MLCCRGSCSTSILIYIHGRVQHGSRVYVVWRWWAMWCQCGIVLVGQGQRSERCNRWAKRCPRQLPACSRVTPSARRSPSSCLVASLPKVQTKLERCGVSRSDWVVDLGAGVWIYKSGWCRINWGCKTKKPSFKSDYKLDHHLYGVRLECMHFPFPTVKAWV